MSVAYRPLPGRGSRGIKGLDPGTAPAFSSAARLDVGSGALLLLSGMVGTSPEPPHTPPPGMRAQAELIFARMAEAIEREGGELADLVRIRIFVTDISPEAVAELHAVRRELFASDRFPASTLVEVSGYVIPGAVVEIEGEAFVPANRVRPIDDPLP